MEEDTVTRRQVVAAGAVGVAGAAGLAALGAKDSKEGKQAAGGGQRMPVAYLPHGGGPWPFVEMGLPSGEVQGLLAYLRSVRALPKAPPRALLVVSAHWEEPVFTVMSGPKPPLFFDYYGFPEASYQLTWPAPGSPALAARVRELLGGAGFETAANAERGFDHGTFVPLKVTYPEADVPTLQLSLRRGLDPEEHLRMGRALAPLRDEGVFIVGSGMTFHNMRGFGSAAGQQVSETFDAWLREAATQPQPERDRRLAAWAQAPAARQAHPREEHLLPLMVIAGAAGADRATTPYNGSFMGTRLSAYHFG